MYSNKLWDSDNSNRNTEMYLGGWRTRRARKRDEGRAKESDGRENEREWHLHWLSAKSHLIKMSERRLETSQGNTVWMSSLEEPSLQDSDWVTRGPPRLSLYFSTLYVGRKGVRQMRGKCGSHRSYSCNIWYSDHHNSGSTVLSLVPIKPTNDRGGFEGKHSSTVNHDDKLGYQQTS